jgi:ketosteroid isomerase-like protein
MSAENVETVRRAYEYWLANGEFLEELTDPEFVWDMSTFRDWPDRKIYEGLDGARQFVSEWGETWDDWQVEVEEYIDAGGDEVVVIVRQSGSAKSTGLRVDMHLGQVWTVRDGRQAWMRMYASPEEALGAAGIER